MPKKKGDGKHYAYILKKRTQGVPSPRQRSRCKYVPEAILLKAVNPYNKFQIHPVRQTGMQIQS
jgi:hypothetical protein